MHFRFNLRALLMLALLLTGTRTSSLVQSADVPSALIPGATSFDEPSSKTLAANTDRLLQLDPKNYTWEEFPTHVDDMVPVSLIFAIKDYGQNFKGLLRSLDDLTRCYSYVNITNIILTHYGDTDALPFDVIESFSATFNSLTQFVHPDLKKPHITLGEAFNKAAKLATSPTLIFLTDSSYNIGCYSMRAMARVLRHPNVGIVAPKILDERTAQQTIFSTGISFVLGKNPHKSTWNNWYVPILPIRTASNSSQAPF